MDFILPVFLTCSLNASPRIFYGLPIKRGRKLPVGLQIAAGRALLCLKKNYVANDSLEG